MRCWWETFTSIPLFARNANPKAESDREPCGARPGTSYKRGRFQRGEKWPGARSARTHRLEEIVRVEPQLAGGATPESGGCNSDLALRESAALAERPHHLPNIAISQHLSTVLASPRRCGGGHILRALRRMAPPPEPPQQRFKCKYCLHGMTNSRRTHLEPKVVCRRCQTLTTAAPRQAMTRRSCSSRTPGSSISTNVSSCTPPSFSQRSISWSS